MIRIVLLAQVLRHLAVLRAHFRVRQFLSRQGLGPVESGDRSSRCYVLIPLLREQRILRDTMKYFEELATASDSVIVLITTERELASTQARSPTTPEIAEKIANGRTVLHFHCPSPTALKADQVNYAARQLAQRVPSEMHHHTLIAIYDADSRPSSSVLTSLIDLADEHDSVSVFHQSATFELRTPPASTLARAIADAGALRANRFVLSYELPRLLNRAPTAGRGRAALSRLTYGHVTGHGLCVRLAWLLEVPLPSSPMEDMYYSFILAASGVPVIPLASLDRSDVPPSPAAQFQQAERWFSGPSRILMYRSDPRVPRGFGRNVTSASALLICAEWLSCAIAFPVLVGLAVRGPRRTRIASGLFLLINLLELVSTDATLPSELTGRHRLQRLMAYPVANTIFGLAAWSNLAKRLSHGSLQEKIER